MNEIGIARLIEYQFYMSHGSSVSKSPELQFKVVSSFPCTGTVFLDFCGSPWPINSSGPNQWIRDKIILGQLFLLEKINQVSAEGKCGLG